ncbi:hypothetical protein [Microbaculum marinum]|uniref:Chromosome segregation protein SMC n=1 Tax=Microbaculum marinum TaxID=1764581 RepID=A0AAW9S2S2_9HYPH
MWPRYQLPCCQLGLAHGAGMCILRAPRRGAGRHMIENIVVFVLGALVATLFALLVIPVIWRRGARLIEERIRTTTPLSMTEIQSEKDMIRADFAVQLRKIEVKYDEIKAQAARRQIELGRRDSTIRELEAELDAREETIEDLEAREEELKNTVLGLERQVTLQASSLKEKQKAISDSNDALRGRSTELSELQSLADSRKVEIAALTTQLENYKSRLLEMRAELATRSVESEGRASAVDEMSGILKSRDAKIALLNDRLKQRRQLTAERRRRAKELEKLLDGQRERVAEKTAALSAAELKRLKFEEDIKKLTAERAELKASLAELEAKFESRERESGGTAGAPAPGVAAALAPAAAATDGHAGDGAGDALLRENIADLAARITRLAAEDGDNEIRALIDAVTSDNRTLNGSGGDGGAGSKVKIKKGAQGHLPLAKRIKEVDLTPGE